MTRGDQYLTQIAHNVALYVETIASRNHDGLSGSKIKVTKRIVRSLVRSNSPVARSNAGEVVAKAGGLEVNRDFASSCATRAEDYVPRNDDDYICPECWVKQAVKVRLLPVNEDARKPSFLCPDCNLSYTLDS